MNDEVTAKIESLGDWRGTLLGRARQAILDADAEIAEEIKWRKASNPLGVPTWSRAGIICTGEVYRDKVKLTFMKGGALKRGQGLFNVEAAGVRRALDLRKRDELDMRALTDLVREAIAINLAGAGTR